MTTTEAFPQIVEEGGVLSGPFRRPRNLEGDQPGSIHNDDVAQKLGFRGGTVAGSFHMEQFPPVLLRAFGPRWFERGNLSCYFRSATMDGEPVRTFARVPASSADARIDVWMEKEDGTQVLEGTAACGAPAETSLLRRKLEEPRDAGELRILASFTPGDALPSRPATLTAAEASRRLAVITEPLDWYAGPSPWGGAIANPGMVVHLLYHAQPLAGARRAVGLFGAIEIEHVNGPVFVDHAYETSGRIVSLGATPKTEYVWYETQLHEPAGGTHVATMLMMLRFMKASSPLWSES